MAYAPACASTGQAALGSRHRKAPPEASGSSLSPPSPPKPEEGTPQQESISTKDLPLQEAENECRLGPW